jgi:hypothetical protein
MGKISFGKSSSPPSLYARGVQFGLRKSPGLIRRNHDLRYVLKDKETDNVFFVVVFTLVFKEDVEKTEATESQATEQPGAGTEETRDSDVD